MAGNSGCVEYGRASGAMINAAFNMTRKRQAGMMHQQQAEAAKLDAAIAKNLEELGYGK